MEARHRWPRRTRSKSRPDPLDEAARALARRDYSARGLDARLARAGIDEHERARAVAALERAGYVDDERFAHERAARLAERGRGDAAIRFDLEQQGVGTDAIERALGSLEPERERALALAASLGDGAKAVRGLAQRGFSDDSIEVALQAVAEEGGSGLG